MTTAPVADREATEVNAAVPDPVTVAVAVTALVADGALAAACVAFAVTVAAAV